MTLPAPCEKSKFLRYGRRIAALAPVITGPSLVLKVLRS